MTTNKNKTETSPFDKVDADLRELYSLLITARDARDDGTECDALKKLASKADALWKKRLDQS
jgi:hypothetical protein